MSGCVRFGTYEFDLDRRELLKHGLHVKVPAQSLEILAALLERPGETVSRERIQKLLWPHGTAVEFEQSINSAVKRLREALGDPADNPRFIERVPRRGYRFIAPVTPRPAPAAGPARTDRGGATVQHYRLIEKAGAGSMGEVWKADDTRLGRTVALKFLTRGLADDREALEAFRREARHAAALNHPNICTIHGLEEDGGERFLVMEYIEGCPLSATTDTWPLPAARVVEIGIQAAEALAAAHSGGVLHRDVKPANIMVTAGGRVKLTDFGIAKALPGRGPPQAEGGAQSRAGTLGYCSPEQARGEPADGRSDVFSLGVVLYEIATGGRPFRGDTPAALLQALSQEDPAPPRVLNPALPRELERVILIAMDKDPAGRWQSAGAMSEALGRIRLGRRRRFRWLAAAAIACGAAAAGLAGWLWTRPAGLLLERDAIVVAEFENKTGETVFDGALRQALLSQMGQSRYVSIVSEDRTRSALRSMRRRPESEISREVALEVCQRTGGKAVLAGSLGKLGNRYFVGLEVIGCAGGEALASEYAEAESREKVLSALSTTVSKMRGRLGESLGSVRKLAELAEATTPSLDALRAYSIALQEKAAGKDPTPFLERAVRLDPDFAIAYFAQAQVHLNRGEETAAEEAVAKAYALRGRVSERERLAIESLYDNLVTGDAVQGVASGLLAARLYPHDAGVWSPSMFAYCKLNEFDKALEVARREIKVAPDDGNSYVSAAMALILLGRTAEAGKMIEQAGGRGIGADMFPFVRGVLAALDDNFAAIDREAESARGKPYEHRVLLLQAHAAGYCGQLAKARAIARQAAERGISSAPAIAASVALNEAVLGYEREARLRAKEALRVDRGRRTAATCALTFALTNEIASAEAVLNDLLRKYPRDTLLNLIWPPAVRGAIALKHGDARKAIEAAAAPPHAARFAWPPFIRGSACLKLGLGGEAAAAFRQIIERKPIQFTSVFTYGDAFAFPLVQLGMARALAMEGRLDASRQAYEEVLDAWRHADAGIPVLARVKAEYAALRRVPVSSGDARP